MSTVAAERGAQRPARLTVTPLGAPPRPAPARDPRTSSFDQGRGLQTGGFWGQEVTRGAQHAGPGRLRRKSRLLGVGAGLRAAAFNGRWSRPRGLSARAPAWARPRAPRAGRAGGQLRRAPLLLAPRTHFKGLSTGRGSGLSPGRCGGPRARMGGSRGFLFRFLAKGGVE